VVRVLDSYGGSVASFRDGYREFRKMLAQNVDCEGTCVARKYTVFSSHHVTIYRVHPLVVSSYTNHHDSTISKTHQHATKSQSPIQFAPAQKFLTSSNTSF